MTSRQARKARREAERQAAKLARKAAPATELPSAPPPPPAPIQDPDLPIEDEFSPEFLAEARAMRERINHRAAINRANAAHSTGPITPEGKLASFRNSLQHGLASGRLIVESLGEDPAAFDALLQSLLQDHQPANTTEELLVREMAQSYWLSQRALRLQDDCFADGQINEKRLALFLRYHTTHQRAFHKALNALLRLQKDRRRAPRRAPARQARGFVSQNAPAPIPQHAEYHGISTPHMPQTVLKQANE